MTCGLWLCYCVLSVIHSFLFVHLFYRLLLLLAVLYLLGFGLDESLALKMTYGVRPLCHSSFSKFNCKVLCKHLFSLLNIFLVKVFLVYVIINIPRANKQIPTWIVSPFLKCLVHSKSILLKRLAIFWNIFREICRRTLLADAVSGKVNVISFKLYSLSGLQVFALGGSFKS